MNKKTKIFKLEEMISDEKEVITINKDVDVMSDCSIFPRGVISKIVICKSELFHNGILVDLYMGKTHICSQIFRADITLDEEYLLGSLKHIQIGV